MNHSSPSVHIKTTGRGELGARAAFACLTNLYDISLRHFKRKSSVELFMAGRCSPDKDAPIVWSVVAYGGSKEEIEFMQDNASF